MTTIILGAGPAGMAVIDGITDTKAGDFIVLDKDNELGGLAQTVNWDSIGTHDLGPHKIFSLDNTLVQRIERLLPESDWLTRDKVSSIYMNHHYLPYPPSPFALSGVFGLNAFFRMVTGYGIARLSGLVNSNDPQTFEEDLVGRLGEPLYNVLFKPIAEKLWGDPKELDVKLSKGRVQTPSIIEVLGRLLKIKKDSEFEALTFRYPKGGLGRLWDAIKKKSKNNGQFLLNHKIMAIESKDKRIQKIHYLVDNKKCVLDVGEDDFVVSTLPLASMTEMLATSLPEHLPKLAREVVGLNDLLLAFLHVDQKSLIKESWVFVPDPNIIFHRLSEQESFDPEMTPNGSIVCCEIMSGRDRPLSSKSDKELCEAAIKGLKNMGYADFKVLHQRLIRLPQSYPVFRTGFENGLTEIINNLDSFSNFRTIGRQGAFNYIGTLDAMDIGYGFAEWLSKCSREEWQQERERTNHYPVLD